MTWRGHQLASRRLAPGERVRAFWICAAILAVAASLLFAIPDGGPAPGPQLEYRPTLPATSTLRMAPPGRGPLKAARRYLGDYLAFVYGGGDRISAATFRAASPSLSARFANSRLRVPPAAQTRDPKLVALDAHPLSAAIVAVAARIADGPVTYSIELTVARQAGRWLVTRVGAD
jgi:hypothetical protein